MTRKNGHLCSGFTTGTAATAAVKAALIYLLAGRPPETVQVELLTGDTLHIAVRSIRLVDDHAAECTVIKDAGDDPDVTHGAEIGARVEWQENLALDQVDPHAVDTHKVDTHKVDICGGRGVGIVTKPGLEPATGRPAINQGPRTMIRKAVSQVLDDLGRQGRVRAEIFVPRGEELARHTLNRRLGIEGGISILGTTGIVRPLSHEAYTATIDAALSVARSCGLRQIVFTTGRRSERFTQGLYPDLPPEAFIQIGDYFAHAMAAAAAFGFELVILGVFFGKAVKMSQRIPHTHARSAALTLAQLARWALEAGCDSDLADQVAAAHTARHAFDLVKSACPALIDKVGREVVAAALAFSRNALKVDVVIFDLDGNFDGELCFNSKSDGEDFSR